MERFNKRILFLVISLSLFIFGACSFMVQDLKNLENNASLKIYLQSTDSDEYDLYTGLKIPEGFYFYEKSEVTIGSTKLTKKYYNRVLSTVYFDLDGGSWGGVNEVSYTGRYGQKLVLPDTDTLVKPGYTFVGWNDAVPFAYTINSSTLKAIWEKTEEVKDIYAPYKIQFYLENKTDDQYTLYSEVENQGKIGDPVDITGYLPIDIPVGYNDPVYDTSVTIAANGSTVVQVKYNLYRTTLTFDVTEKGKFGDQEDQELIISGKYGAVIPGAIRVAPGNIAPRDEDEDIKFVGWNAEGQFAPDYFPLHDVHYEAIWAENTAKYRVQYWLQNDDLETFSAGSSAIYNGTIGEYTKVSPKNITGFAPLDFEQQLVVPEVVDEDGNSTIVTEVNIYYTRARVRVTLSTGFGKWKDGLFAGSSEDYVITGYYGTEIVYPDSLELERTHYEFDKWVNMDTDEDGLPVEFGKTNVILTAKWNQVEFIYTVNHLYETAESPVDAPEYAKDENVPSEIIWGRVGELTEAVAKAAPVGFDDGVLVQQTILNDNSTVVDVKYNRKRVTVSYDPTGFDFATNQATQGRWKANGSTAKTTLTGKYEGVVPLPAEVELTNYNLYGWKNIDSGEYEIPEYFGLNNLSYVAAWTDVGIDYKVVHMFQSLSNPEEYEPNPALKADDDLVAVENQVVTPRGVTTIKGFVPKHADPVTIHESDKPIVLYVYYDRISVTFTYYANKEGESGAAWDDGETVRTVTMPFGTASSNDTKPENPSKGEEPGDYEFAGWDPDVPGSFTDPATMYATWNKLRAKYTVEYTKDSRIMTGSEIAGFTTFGKADVDSRVTVVEVTDFTTPEGYRAVITPVEKLSKNDDSKVKVVFVKKDIIYTFFKNDGTDAKNEISGKFDEPIPHENYLKPSREGYNFTGWTDVDTGAEYGVECPETTFGPNNRSFNAKWEAKDIVYTFNANDGSWNGSETTKIVHGPFGTRYDIPSSNPTRTGYTFAGWDKASELPSDNNFGSKDITLNALWTPNAVSYTFDAGEGSWNGTEKIKTLNGVYDQTLSVPVNPTRDGYNFESWSPVPPAKYGYHEGSNTTFTAQWSKKDITYTFLLGKSGAHWTVPGEDGIRTGKYGDEFTPPELPELAGWVCTGWDDVVDSTFGTANKTYEPIWEKLSITYTFNANGGKFSNGNGTYDATGQYDTLVTRPANPTRDGFEFDGWDESVPDKFGLEDKTFNAKWRVKVTVTPSQSELIFDGDIRISEYKDSSQKTIGLVAQLPEGGSGWTVKWYVGPNRVYKFASNPVTFTQLGMQSGKKYAVTVVAELNGITYTTQGVVTVGQ